MSDMMMKYKMKKRMSKNDSEEVCPHGSMACPMCHGGKMAEGGFVEEEKASGFSDDMVDRIMSHQYSKGGEVANDTAPVADSESAEYDDLVKDDDLEFSETGANSGDEIGDAAEDEDEKDMVSRIMKSRSKKDRLPRPA